MPAFTCNQEKRAQPFFSILYVSVISGRDLEMTSNIDRVFRSNYPELLNAIDAPADFANDFYQEGLVSKNSRDAASEVGNTRLTADKAAQLLTAVQTMVKLNPDMMPKVIRVLRRHVTTKRLGSKMAAEGKVRGLISVQAMLSLPER